MGQGKFRRTTLIAVTLAAFLGGLGLARVISVHGWVLIPLVIFSTLTFPARTKLSLLSIIILGLGVGCWRGGMYMHKLVPYQRLTKQSVIIRGRADSDAVYADKSQISFDLGSLELVQPSSERLVGKIGVKGFGEPMVYRGDVVEVQGKLFPTRGSKQASIGFAQVRILRSSTSRVETIRRNFASGSISALPEPLGSFGLGLLIGQRTTLSKDLANQLSAVGLSHIVAVSGYNLTILVMVAHRLLKKRSKFQALALTLGMIGVFLLFTGSSASIVRASLVSILSLWAWYYGRQFRPSLLIILAAAVTAGVYPLYLWSDLGWWLSFLAFGGVLIAAPMATKRFFGKREPKLLLSIFIETCAAQAVTLPLTMYIFGQVSLIALLANMMIVPLVPLAMLLSLVAGLGGMLVAPIAGWFAWPAKLLLGYMIDIIGLFARLPHAYVGSSISLAQMLAAYIGLVMILAMWWHKYHRGDKITEIKQVQQT